MCSVKCTILDSSYGAHGVMGFKTDSGKLYHFKATAQLWQCFMNF